MKAIYGRNPKKILAKRHAENSNLIKEIRASMNASIRNQGASIKTLEIQIRQMSNVLKERGFGSLPSSTETNPRDHVKSISTIVEANASLIRRIGSHQYAISTRQNSTLMYETKQTTIPFPSHLNDCHCEDNKGSYGPQFSEAYSYGASHIDKSIPLKEKDPGSFTLPCYINNVCFNNALADLGATDVKVPLILGRPFLSTTHAKIDFFKRKITLRVGEEKIIFKTRLMGETLVLNRSLDPFFKDYIELNDLNVPLELRRDQVNDLMPTIEEGEVIKEFRARDDARMVSKIFGYPSDCDHDKKIRIDCAHNLKFSCMIGWTNWNMLGIKCSKVFPWLGKVEDFQSRRRYGLGLILYKAPCAIKRVLRKNTENLNNKVIKLNEELSDCETDLYNYKRGLSQFEARLVEFKNNEIKFCERIRVLERYLELRNNKIENFKNELEEVKKEKESIEFKIEKFENFAKDLDCLLGTQRSVKDKTGLEFNEYTVVPPPPAQVYLPPKNDLSWTGLPEFVDDTVTYYSRLIVPDSH
ncbi:hypothetical protein Tco_1304727, partial [Tanacetum coccineum]